MNYWLRAVDDHSLQAPFIFDFYQKVILPAKTPATIEAVEAVRTNLLHSSDEIEIQDFGAGPSMTHSKKRKISEMPGQPPLLAEFLNYCSIIGRSIKAKNVLELGTSLGITTMYLSMISKDTQVVTMEGSPELSDIASSHLSKIDNVEIRTGDIGKFLPEYITNTNQIDLAYVDANHTLEATMNYVLQIINRAGPSSVLVVGDIHWSDGMEQAWSKLRRLEQVSLSVDLFHCGLLFVRPLREKQHYVIEF